MKRQTILVVDDDKALRDIVASLLELEGYGVVKASNGSEGLHLLASNPNVSLILLDMMMPVVNGWGFLDGVKAQKQMSAIPVVVMSAYAETALSVKPEAVVSKPIHLKHLLKIVETYAAKPTLE